MNDFTQNVTDGSVNLLVHSSDNILLWVFNVFSGCIAFAVVIESEQVLGGDSIAIASIERMFSFVFVLVRVGTTLSAEGVA